MRWMAGLSAVARGRIVVEDGRLFFRATRDTFDVADPKIACATLYRGTRYSACFEVSARADSVRATNVRTAARVVPLSWL